MSISLSPLHCKDLFTSSLTDSFKRTGLNPTSAASLLCSPWAGCFTFQGFSNLLGSGGLMVRLSIRLVRASAGLWAICPCHGRSFGPFYDLSTSLLHHCQQSSGCLWTGRTMSDGPWTKREWPEEPWPPLPGHQLVSCSHIAPKGNKQSCFSQEHWMLKGQ